jgi:hypothetical protein
MLTKDNHDMYTKPPDGCAQFCTHCTASYLNICAPGRLFFFFFFFFFFDSFSVARVRPRTSKGITDLLLLNLVRLEAACPSKKNCLYADSKNRARPPGEPGAGGPLGCRNTPI